MPSRKRTPEERHRENPRCRTCKHREHAGRRCNGLYCSCGDIAAAPSSYPFELPDGDAPAKLVMLARVETPERDGLAYELPFRRPKTPDGPALLTLRLRHKERTGWVASAHSDYFGLEEVYARSATPDRALARLSRMLGGGLDFKARDVDA